MEGKARMSLDPGFHAGMFRRAIIIHDQMEVEFGRSFSVDFLQESNELLMSMAQYAVSNHFAVEHGEGGKHRGRPMTDVVMGYGCGAAILQGQTGLGSIECLDLGFSFTDRTKNLSARFR